jgi:predicted Ser/Thr protein kinase
MSTSGLRLPAGTILGGCRIEEEVGRGGMGVVYRARQLRLDRPVAVKVLSPGLLQDEQFRVRFERESRIIAALEHPNIVPVHEAGEEGDLLFLVMRYVDGPDLGRLLAQAGRLSPERAVAVLEQVAAALDAAHSRGLIHRDVKPANVLLAGEGESEHAYLSDFGVTKIAAAEGSSLTRTGMFVGTLDYIAPEQLRGEVVDRRADVYALACLLFHCLTGHVPYPREDDMAKLYAHGHLPPPRPAEEVEGLGDSAFDDVVARGMAKDPAERFPSAGELARAARGALRGERPVAAATVVAAAPAPTVATPLATAGAPAPAATVAGALPRRRRRRPGALVAVLAGMLVALGAAAGGLAASGVLQDTAPDPAQVGAVSEGSGEADGPDPTPAKPKKRERPRSKPVATATAEPVDTPAPPAEVTYSTYVPGSAGYEAEMPTGPDWTMESEQVINDAIFRTVTRRGDGMTVLIDYTPDEAATYSDPGRCEPTTHPLISSAQVCNFVGGALPQCQSGCVDYLLNQSPGGPGYGVLVGGAGTDEARMIAARVARSLIPR